MSYFTHLGLELEKYLDEDQLLLVKKAYVVALRAHRGQKRRTGEPYITHPVEAAHILAKMQMDYQSIIATLLHDVLEDTLITKAELNDLFGDEVAELVDGVSKLTQIKFESRRQAQAENFRKMVMAMVKDIRVIVIKLADRLHNMRTIEAMTPKKKRRIARETLQIYAPIANRLGMHKFYIDLEDLCFQALHPLRYRVLQVALEKAMGNRKEIMVRIEKEIKNSLKKAHIPAIHIIGRKKHLFSLYKKMRNKQASFSEIMDVYGFRIIVDSLDMCYRVLGVIHNLFKPVAEKFKDYIAIPKVNGYQSLHTVLFGPFGVPIEVQIRTEEMDRVANDGIAAHWIYKSPTGDARDPSQMRAQQWIKRLLELQKNIGSSLEFIETVKIDLFPDEVYVFTPKGEIMELPRGATPVDFAYAVHSDIGDTCVAAKIDRRLAPLSQPLLNGQTVEIITVPDSSPNPAWLNFVVSGRARSNIRHFMKTQKQAESISLGKRLFENALSENDLTTVPQEKLNTLLKELKFANVNELYEAIGLGNQVAQLVVQHLLIEKTEKKRKESVLYIKGTEGIVVEFASCCRPIPGDCIVGYLRAGRGISVHVESCAKINKLRAHPERLVTMRWEEGVKGDFLVDVTIEAENQRGVLASLATTIANAEANIDNIAVDAHNGGSNLIHMTLTVQDRNHLARVMRRIRSLPQILRITRDK